MSGGTKSMTEKITEGLATGKQIKDRGSFAKTAGFYLLWGVLGHCNGW
jgi:hypothetical protein